MKLEVGDRVEVVMSEDNPMSRYVGLTAEEFNGRKGTVAHVYGNLMDVEFDYPHEKFHDSCINGRINCGLFLLKKHLKKIDREKGE